MEIADPYEQYLLAVFQSCNDYYQGSLSAVGLHELCEKLQLQDRCGKLIKCLLGDYKSKRVLFHEFKDGLLKLLGEANCEDKTDGELSPAKDGSLKYGVNKKKYGRRLRLDNKENEEHSSDDSSESQQIQILSCSTDDSGSEESLPKKRRTRGSKRKDGKNDKQGKNDSVSDSQQTSPLNSTTNEVEHLVTAWTNISRGGSENLSRDELVRVFQCVGLERGSEEAAQCVFEKLGLEEHGRITLQDLLEFIRSGGSWSKGARSQHMESETRQANVSMEFIEPSSLGCVSGASLVEQWESAGVPGATQLLQNLGFSPSQQIDLSSLVSLLSDELKGLNDEMKTSRRSMDPHVALVRANSVLQNLYIQSLKMMIEHVNAEKEKLRNDVNDANQRALLLAQEVDDHHSKLEHSTQHQVKVLEQKHTEKIRELTNQAKAEQDTLITQNMVLERKLKFLEEEDNKNKSIISQLQLESKLLEQEHRTVVDQLAAVQRTKEKLEKDLQNVAALQQRVSEMELAMNENDVVSLLERIQTLESENTNLRDRNDELSVEVEELSTKLLNTSIKKRSNSSNAVSADQLAEESIGGNAMKRRGDSFMMIESAEDSGEEGSPRLGKVRKCSHAKDFAEATSSFKELQIHGNSRGECNEDDSSNNDLALTDHEDVSDYNDSKEENSLQNIPFSEELEQAGGASFNELLNQDHLSEEIKNRLRKIENRLKKHDKILRNEVMSVLVNVLKDKKEDSNKESESSLKNRCQELEASLELLRVEYEKTEDYWSEKLEEERTFFEEEQKISDKKYSELLEKILEYEEMLNVEREQRQRLETIEEKDSFEKQVADMEQECSELKLKLAETIKEKDLEMEKLKHEISSLKASRDCVDTSVQVSDNGSVESNETDPQNMGSGGDSDNRRSRRKSTNDHKEKYFGCRQCSELKNYHESKIKYQREIELMREERERLFREVSDKKQKMNNYLGSLGNDKVHDLEQKCHTLMITLRQQQKQTEDILKNTWKQHKAEVKDLKSVLKMTEDKLKRQTKVIQEQLSKLAKTDLLVKDLFVENAYLISSVQKLEHQNQSSANSSKSSSN